MTWLTWRLHRTEAVIGILLFAGLIVTLMYGIGSVDSAHEAAQKEGCFGSVQSASCLELLGTFYDRSSSWHRLTTLLYGIPIAIATLAVIPTLHELERGTHILAWTQSISRRRWTLVRIGFLGVVAAVVSAAWVLPATRWRDSIVQRDGSDFSQSTFDMHPGVLMAYGIFAVALAIAAAVVLRRLVPAIGVLVLGFTATRIFVAYFVRERYRDPVELIGNGNTDPAFAAKIANSWILDQTWINSNGERIPWTAVDQTCAVGDSGYSDGSYQQCLTENGIHFSVTHHPIDRFNQFQAIETALFLGLAASLIVFAYWWLTRKSA